MEKLKARKEPDVRFEEVDYKCKCGQTGRDIVLVANNTGVLDTNCPKCGRRILEIRIFEK